MMLSQCWTNAGLMMAKGRNSTDPANMGKRRDDCYVGHMHLVEHIVSDRLSSLTNRFKAHAAFEKFSRYLFSAHDIMSIHRVVVSGGQSLAYTLFGDTMQDIHL